MAQGNIESTDGMNELHHESRVKFKIDKEQAALVYQVWKDECMCGSGACEYGDCPGPPTERQVASVLAWIDGDGEVPDIFPFRDPEFWSGMIERDGIM